jgi:hypothetical protein
MKRESKKGRVEVVVNHEHVLRSRLRVDTRKWLLSKLVPRTFGGRVENVVTGLNGQAPVLNVTIGNGSSGDKPEPA